jgi:hypothetical protein
MDYIQTKKNIANVLTKGLLRSVIDAPSTEMGLRLI